MTQTPGNRLDHMRNYFCGDAFFSGSEVGFIPANYTVATDGGKGWGGGLITATAVTGAALLARASLTNAVSVPGLGLLLRG